MDDDFNTGGAVGVLFELVRTLNKFVDEQKLEATRPTVAQLATLRQGTTTLRELAGTLGLFLVPPAKKSAAGDDGRTPKFMDLIIELRKDARARKDFATADKIRNALTAMGIVLEDRPSGTEWRAGE